MAVTAKRLDQKNTLDDVLDWMEDNFNGDLVSVSVAAADMVKKKRLATGPIWDEIGVRVLHHTYKVQRIHRPRHKATRLRSGGGGSGSGGSGSGLGSGDSESRAIMYYIDGKYYNLYDLTTAEINEIAAYYDTVAKGNAFERDFLLSVADRLSGDQVVGDVFDEEGLRELRREITNN